MAKKDKPTKAPHRPPKFDTPALMATAILGYVDNCKATKTMPNKAGLCIWLNITRETYNQYKHKDGFTDAIKGAEAWIENAWVQRLGGANATGAIFYLKAAMGYRDHSEVDITSGGKPIQVKQEVSKMTPAQIDEYLRDAFIPGAN